MPTVLEAHQQPPTSGDTACTSLIPSFFPKIQKAVHKSKENAALSWRGWGEGQEGNRFHGAEVINVTVCDEGNEN